MTENAQVLRDAEKNHKDIRIQHDDAQKDLDQFFCDKRALEATKQKVEASCVALRKTVHRIQGDLHKLQTDLANKTNELDESSLRKTDVTNRILSEQGSQTAVEHKLANIKAAMEVNSGIRQKAQINYDQAVEAMKKPAYELVKAKKALTRAQKNFDTRINAAVAFCKKEEVDIQKERNEEAKKNFTCHDDILNMCKEFLQKHKYTPPLPDKMQEQDIVDISSNDGNDNNGNDKEGQEEAGRDKVGHDKEGQDEEGQDEEGQDEEAPHERHSDKEQNSPGKTPKRTSQMDANGRIPKKAKTAANAATAGRKKTGKCVLSLLPHYVPSHNILNYSNLDKFVDTNAGTSGGKARRGPGARR